MKLLLVTLAFISIFSYSISAQIVNGCVFLQGNFVEVGIAPNGGFGTPQDAPMSYHPKPQAGSSGPSMFNPTISTTFITRPRALGFVADVGRDGWAVGSPGYYGDYFMPGTVQEGWALEINGKRNNAYTNNYTNMVSSSTGFSVGNGAGATSLALTGGNIFYDSLPDRKLTLWQGSMDSLSVRQTTLLRDNKSYFVMTVVLKNTGTDTVRNIYYLRTVDPDNEVTNGGSFTTANTIAFQNPNVTNKALVEAVGISTARTYLGLGSKDCRAKVFHMIGGLFPTDSLVRIYRGSSASYNLSGSATADAGIGIIFNLGKIAPGDSATFAYAYILNSADLDDALLETDQNFISGGMAYPSGGTITADLGTSPTISLSNPGTSTWTWSPATGLNTTAGSSVIATVSSVPVTYTVTSSASASGPCGSSGTLSFTITLAPNPGSLPGLPTVVSPLGYCINAPALPLQATASSPSNVLNWYNVPTGGTASLTAPIPATNVAGTYNYYVSQTVAGLEGPRAVITVTVYPLPTLNLIPSGTTQVCLGDSIGLRALAGATDTAVWLPRPFLNFAGANDTVRVFPINTQYYVAKATSIQGCVSFDSILVNVLPLPVFNITPSKPDFCIEDSSLLTASPSAGLNFNWLSSQPLSSTTGNPVWSKPIINTSIIAIATNGNGCRSSDTIALRVNQYPNPNLGPDHPICDTATDILNPGVFPNYLWNTGATSNSIAVRNLGTYWVRVTDAFGCQNTDTVKITNFLPLPKKFLPPDTTFCNRIPVLVKVPGYKAYNWNTGNTTSGIYVHDTRTVILRVTDQLNCTGADTMNLTRIRCNQIFIPNAFTPDNNSNNDIFKPSIIEPVTNYRFTIYNRWGQVVFTTTNYLLGWDGRFKGKTQPVGTYVYYITMIDSDDKPREFKGSVTLIR
jgi:gliding motility-associated-like protein